MNEEQAIARFMSAERMNDFLDDALPKLSVAVLKRKHEHDLRVQQIRNQHFPTKISKFEVNYCIVD